MKIALLLLFGFAVLSIETASTSSYFTPTDRIHAKKVLEEAIASKDIPSVHFGVLGLKLLGEAIPKQADVCRLLLDDANQKPTTETLFYITTAYKAIGNCPQPLPVLNIVKNLNVVLGGDANMQDLHYAVGALAALGQKPQDVAKLVKLVQSIVKKNDSLINLGYLFNIAASLGAEGGFAFDRIEDAIVQADEVDAKFLQFEGGLSITALLVNGAYRLSTSLNKPPPINKEQAVKFGNYFLSRRSVQTPKGVWSLLDALTILSTNKFHIPVAISLFSSSSVSTESPLLTVHVSDVLGRALGPLSVVADSATRVSDDVVVLSKKKFEPTSDSAVYSFNLMESKPERGLYKLTISAALTKPDPRIASSLASTVSVKVMCAAAIDFIDLGAADADQTTQPKFDRVTFPQRYGRVLEVDTQQKLTMKFSVKDKSSGKLITVHQAFVRFQLLEKGRQHSVILVAEHDNALQYKFDLDVGAKAADFDNVGGVYEVELLIGDAVLSNSFSWKVANVKLTFSREPKEEHKADELYKPKPEIQHLFREPEVRPAPLVSNLFTLLAAFPLLLLLLLWARLPVNLSNFPFTLSALGFHLGLGAIFALFGLFWLQLDMFQTVKYLLAVGLVTFVCGNKLLNRLAHSKK